MKTDLPLLLLSSLAGAGLGLLYAAALWWTVRRLATAPQPVLWIVGSYYLRLAGLGLGLYLVMAGSLARLAAAFAGFVLVRLLAVRRVRPPADLAPPPTGENR